MKTAGLLNEMNVFSITASFCYEILQFLFEVSANNYYPKLSFIMIQPNQLEGKNEMIFWCRRHLNQRFLWYFQCDLLKYVLWLLLVEISLSRDALGWLKLIFLRSFWCLNGLRVVWISVAQNAKSWLISPCGLETDQINIMSEEVSFCRDSSLFCV